MSAWGALVLEPFGVGATSNVATCTWERMTRRRSSWQHAQRMPHCTVHNATWGACMAHSAVPQPHVRRQCCTRGGNALHKPFWPQWLQCGSTRWLLPGTAPRCWPHPLDASVAAARIYARRISVSVRGCTMLHATRWRLQSVEHTQRNAAQPHDAPLRKAHRRGSAAAVRAVAASTSGIDIKGGTGTLL